MDALEELLARLEKEMTAQLVFNERMQKFRAYSDEFSQLKQQWIRQLKEGVALDVEALSTVLDAAVKKRRATQEYPSPKQINLAYILSVFSRQLNELNFLKDEAYQGGSCNCQVRLQHRMPPEIKLLKKVGRSRDWAGVIFDIMECTQCSIRWVRDNAGGVGIIIDQWKEWQVSEFPLMEGS